jgi:hypothetical protein
MWKLIRDGRLAISSRHAQIKYRYSREGTAEMAKGQKRGTREAKKPKQTKPVVSTATTLFAKSEEAARAKAHPKVKRSS